MGWEEERQELKRTINFRSVKNVVWGGRNVTLGQDFCTSYEMIAIMICQQFVISFFNYHVLLRIVPG